GSTTLQVCTSVMHRGFGIIDDLCDGMTRWLEQKGYSSPMDIVGLSLKRLLEHDGLPHGIKVYSQIDQETCIHCGLCYVACRDGGHQAIKFYPNRTAQVVEKKCVGCGLCAQVCPVPGCVVIK
ncbi:MAG: 4Fe-4S dicluster-binding protein, partial [Anaerolineaceae bacterium]